MIPIFVGLIVSACGLIGVAYAPGYRPGRVVHCTPLADSEINTLMGFIISVPIIIGLIFTVRGLREAPLPPYTPRLEATETLPDYHADAQGSATERSPAYDHTLAVEAVAVAPARMERPTGPPPAYDGSLRIGPVDEAKGPRESEV